MSRTTTIVCAAIAIQWPYIRIVLYLSDVERKTPCARNINGQCFPPCKPGCGDFAPRCGKGKIFDGFLTLKKACPVCGLDLSFADPADGPAFFVICFACIPSACICCLARSGLFATILGAPRHEPPNHPADVHPATQAFEGLAHRQPVFPQGRGGSSRLRRVKSHSGMIGATECQWHRANVPMFRGILGRPILG